MTRRGFNLYGGTNRQMGTRPRSLQGGIGGSRTLSRPRFTCGLPTGRPLEAAHEESREGGPSLSSRVAYFAGLLEGEGCIDIVRHRRRPGAVVNYTPTIAIGMTDPEPVRLAAGLFGNGSPVAIQERRTSGGRVAYHTQTRHAGKTREILLQVLPYLRTKRKRDEARWTLALCDRILASRGRGHAGYDLGERKTRHWLYEQCQRAKYEVGGPG